ncbi:glycosyltransferase [Orrella sp. JC864]|uniref:glycosyltransferase family 2 protein n=1 Tax=Orrella sp. JC864 TaxID=3120298 RepID=UPI00300BAE46
MTAHATARPADLSICICTYKRPAQLDALLAAILAQDTAGKALECVVVDNDPQRSAAAVLTRWQDHPGLPVRALHERTPNIALARNAAVHAATGDWIVFVDDDEEPEPGWLLHLVAAQQACGADAVFGPVLPRYAPGTPAWMREGGYFDRPRYRSGTPITARDARTGNVLVRREALMSVPGPFDAAYGRTGGSDTVLFGKLLEQGRKLVWCDEAAVLEDVPPERARLGWILQRAYRGGQTFVRAEMKRRNGPTRWALGLYLGLRAGAQLLAAGLLALLTLPGSRTRAVRWLRTAAAQAGKLAALAGHRYQEYRH